MLAAPFETQGKRALEESDQHRHPERSADGEERGAQRFPGLSPWATRSDPPLKAKGGAPEKPKSRFRGRRRLTPRRLGKEQKAAADLPLFKGFVGFRGFGQRVGFDRCAQKFVLAESSGRIAADTEDIRRSREGHWRA